MPGPLVAPLIAAGASLFGQGLNAISQGSMNRKTRQWNEKMYAQQRQDSLSDWAMQNEYNSPRMQMQRFQEAGLNPNLIYGQTNTANPVRSTEAKGWNPQAPQFAPEQSIMAYQEMRRMKAQTDNLTVQNTLLLQEQLLKNLKIRKDTVDTEVKESLKQVQIDSAYALKELIGQRSNLVQEQQSYLNDRASRERETWEKLTEPALKHKLQQEVEKVYMMQTNRAVNEAQKKRIEKHIELMQKDGKLKDLQIKMEEKGIRGNDPWYFRVGSRIYDELF